MSESLIEVPIERVEGAILLIRGEKVILDSDLAGLYGISTTRLNQQVNRNLDRFPADFMFQLTSDEFRALMLQNATSKASEQTSMNKSSLVIPAERIEKRIFSSGH